MRYFRLALDAPWGRIVFATAALMLAPATAGTSWAQEKGQVFVANYYGDSVTMYPLQVTGNTAPALTIPEVLQSRPHQLTINHRLSELIVTNNVLYTVSIFDRATGTLKRTIGGLNTLINRPTGVAVDETRGELYVANDWGRSITVYDDVASGDVAPKRTITSWALLAPVGLSVDTVHDELVVSDYVDNSILTFERSADGPSEPKRRIRGAGLTLPQEIALDLTHDEILVSNSIFYSPGVGAILAFNRTDDGVLLAPLRKLEGSATGLCNPYSVAVDYVRGEIVVANACSNAITTYDRAANGDVAPKRTIAGPSTLLNYPTSAAIFYGASLSVSNKPSSGNVAAGSTITYNITAAAGGGSILDARLGDALPGTGGLTWNLGGTDAAACTLVNNQLNCAFGNLVKGQTKSIKVFAATTTANCPTVSNQVAASYNDGTGLLTTASSVAIVNVKCK